MKLFILLFLVTTSAFAQDVGWSAQTMSVPQPQYQPSCSDSVGMIQLSARNYELSCRDQILEIYNGRVKEYEEKFNSKCFYKISQVSSLKMEANAVCSDLGQGSNRSIRSQDFTFNNTQTIECMKDGTIVTTQQL